jgi:hypothetical protein
MIRKYILFLISSIFFSCISKNEKTPQDISQKRDGKEIIAELEKLHLFNLTDATELEAVKVDYEKSYTEYHFFQGPTRKESLGFMDNRYHFVDCEALFEEGGLTKYLQQVQITFAKLGLQLAYGNEKSEQDETSWKHTIELNGIKYTAFDGAFTGNAWSIAFINFLEMLNAELKRQNSEEQFYPIRGGNDGSFVLLTPQQFKFVQQNYPRDNDHPKTIAAWKSANGF